jgi:rhamnose transport system permease protein
MASYLWKRYGRQVILAIILLIQMFVLGRISPHFVEPQNLLDMSTHLAEAGIIAVGMTFIIMTGGIDLSVGSLLALCGIAFGYLVKPMGLWPAAGAAIVTGLIGGSINGGLVALGRLPSLVVTLGTMALFRGAAMVISQGRPASGFPEGFSEIGRGEFAGMPVQLLLWIALTLVGMIIADRSRVGRYVIAVGDNVTAARYAALPERTVTMALYVATGLLTALAALVFTARVSTAKADAGVGLELEVITAVVLGGTAITGGRGTVLGTFLGVLILGFLRSGLSFAGVSTVYQTILSGAILIIVSIINQRMLERETRPRRKPGSTDVSPVPSNRQTTT